MTDRRVDDLVADLKSALDVRPSPGFAAGVRARVERPRATFWSFWSGRTIAASAALGAAAVIAAVLFVRPQPSIDTKAPVSAAVETPVPSPGTIAPAPATAAARPAVRKVPARAAAEPATAPTASLDRMAVVTDQGEILQRIWARAGRGTVAPEEFGRALEAAASTTAAAIEIREIVIPPIVVWDPEPVLPAGVPIIKRVVDSESTRSAR